MWYQTFGLYDILLHEIKLVFFFEHPNKLLIEQIKTRYLVFALNVCSIFRIHL